MPNILDEKPKMPKRDAVRLLADTLAAQHEAEAKLRKCQEQGGDLFRSSRIHLKMDQAAMAKALSDELKAAKKPRTGLHNTYLSKVENGKAPPGIHLLEALHSLLSKHKPDKG